jgi:hypothetical protein
MVNYTPVILNLFQNLRPCYSHHARLFFSGDPDLRQDDGNLAERPLSFPSLSRPSGILLYPSLLNDIVRNRKCILITIRLQRIFDT